MEDKDEGGVSIAGSVDIEASRGPGSTGLLGHLSGPNV